MTTAIDDLAGVALNRAVAVALGWRVERENDYYILHTPDGVIFNDEACWYMTTAGMAWEEIPNYATNLEAVWRLVEGLHVQIIQHGNGRCAVWIGSMPPWDGETLPVAICRAWLRWQAAQTD